MTRVKFLCFFFLSAWISSPGQNKFPFPQHLAYTKGVILPNPGIKKNREEEVIRFYSEWKKIYLRKVEGKNQDYVWKTDSLQRKTDTICVSEGQGYGMMILVYMAGKDPQARALFDGLFRFARAHPSDKSPYLMAWIQDAHYKSKDLSTASDGDVDIGYALLLADKQWGNSGSIHYKEEALKTIRAIKEQEINPSSFSVMLSNYTVYSKEDKSKDCYDTRSSDFMPVNFKAFGKASGDPFWEKLVKKNYTLFHSLQERFSPDAGLVPDFILHVEKGGRPAYPNYLEYKYDGKYYYNACRVPWRIGLDYILNGDMRAKEFVGKINTWIRKTTGDNPDNISAGYTLSGEDLRGQNFEALSFICPFGVSAMVDAKNQAWLNRIWKYSLGFPVQTMDYYDNTLKMLNLLVLSGNAWDY